MSIIIPAAFKVLLPFEEPHRETSVPGYNYQQVLQAADYGRWLLNHGISGMTALPEDIALEEADDNYCNAISTPC